MLIDSAVVARARVDWPAVDRDLSRPSPSMQGHQSESARERELAELLHHTRGLFDDLKIPIVLRLECSATTAVEVGPSSMLVATPWLEQSPNVLPLRVLAMRAVAKAAADSAQAENDAVDDHCYMTSDNERKSIDDIIRDALPTKPPWLETARTCLHEPNCRRPVEHEEAAAIAAYDACVEEFAKCHDSDLRQREWHVRRDGTLMTRIEVSLEMETSDTEANCERVPDQSDRWDFARALRDHLGARSRTQIHLASLRGAVKDTERVHAAAESSGQLAGAPRSLSSTRQRRSVLGARCRQCRAARRARCR